MFNYSIKDLERDLFRRNRKYTVMGTSIATIHVIYLLLFYLLGFWPMVFYNFLIVALYMYFGIVCTGGVKVKSFFIFLCIEIPLHSTLCTYVLGFDYNFMFFMFGMIPIVFYLILFIDEIVSFFILPTALSLIYMLIYIVVNLSTNHFPPYISTDISNKYLNFFMYFNIVIAFIMILAFSIIFSFEYNYVHKKLTSENNILGSYASYDTLTGLLNRRSIDSHLDKIFKDHYHEEEGFSVIMCDIDHFKSVNDTYGHDAGDHILKEVSQVISSEVRDGDVVGRWGGEEFLIILNKNKATAAMLAERIRNAVENNKYIYKGQKLNITITLGVSSYHYGSDISAIIRSADKKLYRGKENGRNQVVS